MSMYNQKRKRSKKERIGFYTAFSICLVAVGMAAYSTYTNMTGGAVKDQTTPTQAVNRVVTGVTEKETKKQKATTEETVETTVPTTVATAPSTETAESKTALETMLTVNTNLSYPLDKATVQKEYSEETVYNKTLNQWEAHTGVDFKCNVGDNVYSMGDGQVEKVYKDDILGQTVVVKSATYTAYYSGLSDNVKVSKGQKISTGDIIATVGTVPGEVMDDSHIHIAIKVGNQYVDPLTLINNNE